MSHPHSNFLCTEPMLPTINIKCILLGDSKRNKEYKNCNKIQELLIRPLDLIENILKICINFHLLERQHNRERNTNR